MNLQRQRILLLNTRAIHQSPPPPRRTQNHPILLSKLETCHTITQFSQIHASIITSGLFPNILFSSRLLKTSSAFSLLIPKDLHMTTLLFTQIHNPDVFCYNLMIKAHSKSPTPLKSISFYQQMLLMTHNQLGTVHPNEYTFCFLLDSCSSHGPEALLVGRQVHAHLGKHGLASGLFVGTSLVNMYSKCGVFDDARRVFHGMPHRNEVSWGAMVDACVARGYVEEAFGLFREMRLAGIEPTNATLVGVIRSCGKVVGRLATGRAAHGFVVVRGLELNVTLGTSLVDMYAKCGSIEVAREVFTVMPLKSVASWNCMINGLAMNGNGIAAVGLFKAMRMASELPNSSTFVAVLNACNHAGLVKDGEECFSLMSRGYKIAPNLKHYGCMVDLYGRVARIRDAVEVIKKMPVEPDSVIWVALSEACRMHGYKLLGEITGAQLVKLLPYDACLYLLFSNTYASSRRWNDVASVRKIMMEMNLRKVPGCSSIAQ